MRESESLLSRSFHRTFLAGLIILSGLFCWESYAEAQTIAYKDLSLFRSRITRTPIYEDSAQLFRKGFEIDVSAFFEWNLDTLRADGKVWSQIPSVDPASQCMFIDTNNGSANISIPHRSFSLYIMNDVFGYGGGKSVLTTWEWHYPDSIEFLCAQQGPFDGSMSVVKILRMGYFPDSSVLLVISEHFGDAEDFSHTYAFLRGSWHCDFKPFYVTQYDNNSDSWIEYDMKFLFRPSSEIIETSVWVQSRFEDGDILYSPDSVCSRIINLWEIAKDSLGIK